MSDLYISIVLFHQDFLVIKQVIIDILNTNLSIKIFLIDNSSHDKLKVLETLDKRIEYVFNNENLGYGAGHNIAIRQSINDKVPHHLVVNPDVNFDSHILGELVEFMESNSDVGNIMPKVLYPDGKTQYLCKLLPTPVDLFLRRFLPASEWKDKRNTIYELKDSGYDEIMNVPALSGCFMFCRVSALNDVGLFDEKFFMYLEDVDLNRRIHVKYKTIFYPDVFVVHNYEKGSYKNWKLLSYHIRSAFYYFNKWGWFFDKQRSEVNAKCLERVDSISAMKNL